MQLFVQTQKRDVLAHLYHQNIRRFKMKKTLLLATTIVWVLMLGVCAAYAQPMGPGMMGQGYGYGPPYRGNWNYCPYCGSYMGPGMMGGMMGRGMMGGGMMGGGMMGPGYGYGYGPQSQYGYGQQYQQPPNPLDKEQAKQEVENYLRSTRNPNLKMGKIEDKGNDYEVRVETKDGSLADKILVNKDTGWMRSAY
jgi:hypothetical protein